MLPGLATYLAHCGQAGIHQMVSHMPQGIGQDHMYKILVRTQEVLYIP